MSLINRALNALYTAVDEPENVIEHRDHAIDLLTSALGEMDSLLGLDDVEDVIRLLEDDIDNINTCINDLEILNEEI